MKNQAFYPAMESANVFSGMSESIYQSVCESKFVKGLLEICSLLLEEEVSLGKVLSLLHVHLSFLALVLFGGISVVGCLLLMGWFLLAAYQCWRKW